MEVTWKDPLAILYLTPVPKELQLHYGIEISSNDGEEKIDKLVEIVGYQETRYFRQIWHYHNGSSGMDDSTLTLNTPNAAANKEALEEPFVYRESFSNIQPPSNGSIQVNRLIWQHTAIW
jgi:hypothetical protein